ncbi:MAG: hypothetical protein Q8J74_13110 [Candidatus Didemnitutus sp.]|nr:hypothetical protein [Candidatus Didemnitutus sp.]
MRNLPRLIIFVLGLTTATTLFYAFQQHRALGVARLTAEALEKERLELRRKLWDAERRQNRPRADSATADADSALALPHADGSVNIDPARAAGADMRGMAGRMFSLLDNPEAQRLLAIQQKGTLDARYGALFRMLNLSPEQLDQFKDMLVEKRTSLTDVVAAARSQGMTGRENRDEIQALVQQTQAEVDAGIRALLGDNAFAQYQAFEQTQPQRAVVGQLEQRLSYSNTPLTPQQSEQLVQVLAANAAPRQPNAGGGGMQTVAVRAGPGGGAVSFGGTGGAPISDQAVQQASTVLNSTQLQTLQQLQQEQEAQSKLNQLMREQMRPRRQSPNGGG